MPNHPMTRWQTLFPVGSRSSCRYPSQQLPCMGASHLTFGAAAEVKAFYDLYPKPSGRSVFPSSPRRPAFRLSGSFACARLRVPVAC